MQGQAKDKSEFRLQGDEAYERGDILAAAEWYYKAGEFGKAAELFEWEKQYQKAAQSYFKNQEYDAAADNYLKVSDEETAIEMFELGREFKKAADVAFQIQKYHQAGKLYERAGNYLEAGKAYFLLNDSEKALSTLEKINKKDPRYLEALLKIAEIFLKTGNYQAVIERIEKFLDGEMLNKSNLALFHALAQAYENSMDFKQALDIYRRISKFDPRFPKIQHKLVKIENIIQKTIKFVYSERFKKEQRVGKGAMGVVYKAEDLHLKRPIALKILNQKAITDNSDIDRFFSEARKAAKLQHQNIVTVYDAGQMDNDYFISMEFIQGVDLLTILKNKHPISITNLLVIAHRLFSALDHSHRRGVIHRDIKPNNIMITYENEIKVVDFGIATLKEDLRKKDRHAILGTPCYMSPEQIEGKTNDQCTDIYSAGVTLFHLTTGNTPYNGSVLEIFNKHLKEPIPSVKQARNDSPGKLIRLIEKCMAKKKENRYQSARQVLDELDKAFDINGAHIEIGKTTLKIIEDGDSKTILLDREISPPGSVDESDLPTSSQNKSEL